MSCKNNMNHTQCSQVSHCTNDHFFFAYEQQVIRFEEISLASMRSAVTTLWKKIWYGQPTQVKAGLAKTTKRCKQAALRLACECDQWDMSFTSINLQDTVKAIMMESANWKRSSKGNTKWQACPLLLSMVLLGDSKASTAYDQPKNKYEYWRNQEDLRPWNRSTSHCHRIDTARRSLGSQNETVLSAILLFPKSRYPNDANWDPTQPVLRQQITKWFSQK